MAVAVCERANEVTFEIRNSLAGADVLRFQQASRAAQSHDCWRQIVIDISELRYCDAAGERILSNLAKRENRFSARNSQSLDLLRRLSNPDSPSRSIGASEVSASATGDKPRTLFATA